MIQLDYRDARPPFLQVKDGFRRLIGQGVLKKDEKMPSVRSMATQLTINPNTIQRAYRELEQEGYIYSVAGKGSFVAGTPKVDSSKKQELLQSFDRFVEELILSGITPEELAGRLKEVEMQRDEENAKGGEEP